MESTIEYVVSAMSCGHCVSSIRSEVEKLAGVTGVAVDLGTKIVAVTGSDLRDADIRHAIDEAGFEVDAT